MVPQVLALLVLVCVAHGDEVNEMIEKMAENAETCIKETDVDPLLVIKLTEEEYTDDEGLKCYLKCLLTKIEAMDEDGQVDVDIIEKLYQDDLDLVESCKNLKGTNACDTAYVITKCLEKIN